MFELRKKRLLFLALLLGAGSLIMTLISVMQLRELIHYNEAIKSDDIKEATPGSHLTGRFASAWSYHQSGEYAEALNVYREIETQGSDAFKQTIRYNQADLYLQMASQAERRAEKDIATPLIELAKHQYRDLLRENSQNWAAKYNLETALKLLPDLDPAEFPDDILPERSPEAAGSVEIDRELP